ncbi:MAG: DUF4136 domain-containing protein [Lentimicrobium sp.]|nr:DUF4136 domain-containing protein [Lentimicrobium sp.]
MKLKALLTLSLMGLMFACGPSTKLEKSWADPSFSLKPSPYKKVLVVAPLKDAASQRIAEDKIVKQIKAGTGIQSYSYLKPGETDEKMLQAQLVKDGFDGVIVMHLTDVEKSVTYNPGTSYGGWYGYRSYTPGYYSEDKTFLVETNMYSVKDDKLMWSGTTSSLNPTSFDKSMDEIIYAIKTELQKKGILEK